MYGLQVYGSCDSNMGKKQSETLVSDIESTEVTGYGPTKSKKRHLSGSLQKPESAEITKGS